MHYSRIALLLAATFAVAAQSIHAAEAKITASIEGRIITARSMTPGGDTLFFGVGLDSDGYNAITVRWSEIVRSTPKDGTVTFTATKSIPLRAIVVVVDMQTGQYAIVSPLGYRIKWADRPAGFAKDDRGVQYLPIPSPFFDAVYVRPGLGAWRASVTDGGVGKERGSTLRLADFESVEKSGDRRTEERDRALVPGGLLITIDSYSMELTVTRLDGSTPGEQR